TQSTGANTLVYSTLFGSGTASTGGHDVATGLAVDAQGRAYLSGYSKGTIPHTSNAFQASNANTNTLDAFVAKIDPSLGSSGLLYSTFIGGTQDDAAKAIALDGAGLAYITGSTNSYDAQRNLPAQYPYPTTSTAFQGPRTSATYDDAFVSQVFTPSVTVSAPFDFNGDGSNDLLFQNSSGQVVAWYMQASVYVGGSFTSVDPASGYKLVGAGDINADGKPDLVFQNTSTGVVVIWYMNGVTYSSGATVSTTPASGYNVVGVGPFYGHSNPDLVFQNTSNGNVAIWYMSGASYSSGVTLSSTLPSGYTVAGCGHFGGTGGMDIVLQNTSTGAVTFWLLGGTSSSPTITTASLTGAATSLPSGYHIAAIADYNLDGQPDMVLQNGTSLLFYFMNGTVVTGIQAASASPASGYNVAGPH
ncbi:MAG: hypothetical protein JWN14_5043, partial [Chthonomonadales bacterium]|nr:hypothetical protein [Chthonomonadales bacterium]